jgi:hypothetical protein
MTQYAQQAPKRRITEKAMFRISVLLVLAALSSACSGGGGGGDGGGLGQSAQAICQVIGNGSPVTSSAVQPSSFDDSVLAFDGHLDSWATLGPAASAGGTISGGDFERPGIDVAGIAYTSPHSGTVAVTITTYLDGVVQDSGDAGTISYTNTGDSMVCPSTQCIVRQNGLSFGGIDTTGPYDRIEAAITITNLDAPLQIRELCVR